MPQVHNAFIAGYLGYVNLGKLAGQDVTIQETELNRLLALRATNFRTFNPNEGTTGDARYCRALTTAKNFMYLTPELGQYLHDHALPAVQSTLDNYYTIAPYWFVSRYESVAGEGSTDTLYNHDGLFKAKAWILQEPYTELTKYLDIPAFDRGDLFYLDHLVATLEAASANPQPTGTVTPTPVPGDANNDTQVDGLDYVIWLNHYNTSPSNGISDGDFNGSGNVDGLDYVMWLNNYGT